MVFKASKICKIISLIIIVIFAHEQIGWVQEGRPVWADLSKAPSPAVNQRDLPVDLEVPYDSGTISEAGVNGGKELIINIQDAHASLSAQYSITNILNELVTKYHLELIALEGAEGYVDTSVLRTFPDKEIRKNTAELLMREGRMSAGEFFAVTSGKEGVALYGVEDNELYERNIEGFREVMEERAFYLDGIEELRRQLEALAEKIYSKELKALEDNAGSHNNGDIGFSEYWETLKGIADDKGVVPAGSPSLEKLLKTIELEKRIDFKNADTERKRLIDALSSSMTREDLEDLVLKSLEFKENRISQASFHLFLKELAISYGEDLLRYRELWKFTDYVKLYEEIDILPLFSQIRTFEDVVREKLYRNAGEKELKRWMVFTELLQKLYSVELSSPECAELVKARYGRDSASCSAFIKRACGEHSVAVTGGYDLEKIFSGIDGALRFYRTAEARDNAILGNTIARMRKEGKKVAALITGGYHTSGLKELMKDNNLSYLIITPKFADDKERPYIAILTNKNKPYQKLLEAGRYQLAVRAYFDGMDEEKFLEQAIYALSSVAFEGGDWRSEAERWHEIYSREYKRLRALDEENVAESLTPLKFAFILGTGDLSASGQLTIEKRSERGKEFIFVVRKRGDQNTYFRLDPGDGGVLQSPQVLSPRQGLSLVEGRKTGQPVLSPEAEALRARMRDDKTLLYDAVNRLERVKDIDPRRVARVLRAMPDFHAAGGVLEIPLSGELSAFTGRVLGVRAKAARLEHQVHNDAELARGIAMYFVAHRDFVPAPASVAGQLSKRLSEPLYLDWDKIAPIKSTIGEFTIMVRQIVFRYRDIYLEGYEYTYHVTVPGLERTFEAIAEKEGTTYSEVTGRFNGEEGSPTRILEVGEGPFHPVRDYFTNSPNASEYLSRETDFRHIQITGIDPMVEEDRGRGYYKGNALRMEAFGSEQFDHIFCAHVFNEDCFQQYYEMNKDFWQEHFPGEEFFEAAYYSKIALELFRVLKPGGKVYLTTGPEFNEALNAMMTDLGFKLEFSEKSRSGCNVFVKPDEDELPVKLRRHFTMRAIRLTLQLLEEKLALMEEELKKIPAQGELTDGNRSSLSAIEKAGKEIAEGIRLDISMPHAESLRRTLSRGGNLAAFDIRNILNPLVATCSLVSGEENMEEGDYQLIERAVSRLRGAARRLGEAEKEHIYFVAGEDGNTYTSFVDWKNNPPLDSREWRAHLALQQHGRVLESVNSSEEVQEAFDKYAVDLARFCALHREGKIVEPVNEEERTLMVYALGYLFQTDPERVRAIGEFARRKIYGDPVMLSEQELATLTKFIDTLEKWRKMTREAMEEKQWKKAGKLCFRLDRIVKKLKKQNDNNVMAFLLYTITVGSLEIPDRRISGRIYDFTEVDLANGVYVPITTWVEMSRRDPEAFKDEVETGLLPGSGTYNRLENVIELLNAVERMGKVILVDVEKHACNGLYVDVQSTLDLCKREYPEAGTAPGREIRKETSIPEGFLPIRGTGFYKAWESILAGHEPALPVLSDETRAAISKKKEGVEYLYNYDKISPALRHLFHEMGERDRETALKFARVFMEDVNVKYWTFRDFEHLHGLRALVRNLLVVIYNREDVPDRLKSIVRGMSEGVGLLALYIEQAICLARLKKAMGEEYGKYPELDIPCFASGSDDVSDEEYFMELEKIEPYQYSFKKLIRKRINGKVMQNLHQESSKMNVYTREDLPFVVKSVKAGAQDENGSFMDFTRSVLPGLLIARKRLGGLAANALAVQEIDSNIDGTRTVFDNAIIQTKVTPLREKFAELARQGGNDAEKEAARLIGLWWKLQIDMWKRGVADAGMDMLDSYGYDEATDKVVIFDYRRLQKDPGRARGIIETSDTVNYAALKELASSIGAEQAYYLKKAEILGVSYTSKDDVQESVWPSAEEAASEEYYIPLNDPLNIDSAEFAEAALALEKLLGDKAYLGSGISGGMIPDILNMLEYNMLWLHAGRRMLQEGLSRDPGIENHAVMLFKMGVPDSLRTRVLLYLKSRGFEAERVGRIDGKIGMDVVLRRWGKDSGLERSVDDIEKDITALKKQAGEDDKAAKDAAAEYVRGAREALTANDGEKFYRWLIKVEKEMPDKRSVRLLRYSIECLNRGIEMVILRSRVPRQQLAKEFGIEWSDEMDILPFQDFFKKYIMGPTSSFKAADEMPFSLRGLHVAPALRNSDGDLRELFELGLKLGISEDLIGLIVNGIHCPKKSELPKEINDYLQGLQEREEESPPAGDEETGRPGGEGGEGPENIAITGITGFIGPNLDSAARRLGVKVTGISRGRRAPKFDKGLPPQGLAIEKGDLMDPDMPAFDRIMRENPVFYHLGGMSNHQDCAERPFEALAVNGLSTAILAALARRNGTRMIFASTFYVYSLTRKEWKADSPVREEEDADILKGDEPEIVMLRNWLDGCEQVFETYVEEYTASNGKPALSPLEFVRENIRIPEISEDRLKELGLPKDYFYPLTKLLGERFVKRLENGMIVRFSNIYGPAQDKEYKIPMYILGDLRSEKTDPGAFKGMTEVPRGGTFSVRDGWRDYLYVEDCARALLKAAAVPITGQTKVINISSGKPVDNVEVGEAIRSALGKDVKVEAEKVKDKAVPVCDNSRFRIHLHPEELTPLEEGMRRTVPYYLDIMQMDDAEILRYMKPEYAELRKHGGVDWRYGGRTLRFARLTARALGIEEGSRAMNMLRVLCLAHDIGGVLGVRREEAIEEKLVTLAKPEYYGIEYRGRNWHDVLRDFEARERALTAPEAFRILKKLKEEEGLELESLELTEEEKSFIPTMDHPNNSLRILESQGVSIPDDVRKMIRFHMENLGAEQLSTWTKEERTIMACFITADCFEAGNNLWKRGHFKARPMEHPYEGEKSTLKFLSNPKFKFSGYPEDERARIIAAVTRLVKSGKYDESIRYSRSSLATVKVEDDEKVLRKLSAVIKAARHNGLQQFQLPGKAGKRRYLGVAAALLDSDGAYIHGIADQSGPSELYETTGKKYDHAEINAIRSAEEAGLTDWENYTLVVSLEPCDQCAKAIIARGIKKVVIAALDPTLGIRTNGVKALLSAGVEVTIAPEEYQKKALEHIRYKFRVQDVPPPHVKLPRYIVEDTVKEGIKITSRGPITLRLRQAKGYPREFFLEDLRSEARSYLEFQDPVTHGDRVDQYEFERCVSDLLKETVYAGQEAPQFCVINADSIGAMISRGLESAQERKPGNVIRWSLQAASPERPFMVVVAGTNENCWRVLSQIEESGLGIGNVRVLKGLEKGGQVELVEAEPFKDHYDKFPPATPGTLKYIKDIVAPKMPFRTYSLRVAPWLEEILFYALPMIAAHFAFGLDSMLTVDLMLAVRLVFLALHDGAVRPGATPREWKVPLKVAIFGALLAVLPFVFPALAARPEIFIPATSLFAATGHAIANLVADFKGEDPATLAEKEEASGIAGLGRGAWDIFRKMIGSAYLSNKLSEGELTEKDFIETISRDVKDWGLKQIKDPAVIQKHFRALVRTGLIREAQKDKEERDLVAHVTVEPDEWNKLWKGLVEDLKKKKIPPQAEKALRKIAGRKGWDEEVADVVSDLIKVEVELGIYSSRRVRLYFKRAPKKYYEMTPEGIGLINRAVEDNIKQWIDLMRKGDLRRRQVLAREITSGNMLDLHKNKDADPERMALFKKYSDDILDILLTLIKEEIRTLETGEVEHTQSYWSSLSILEAIVQRTAQFKEHELTEKIMELAASIPHSREKKVLAKLQGFYMSMIAIDPERGRTFLFYLMAHFARHGNKITETDNPLFGLVEFINKASTDSFYYFMRKVCSFYLRDHSGQVNVDAEHPLRCRTRTGVYGFNLEGVIRDSIHNNLGSYVIGLLERMLQYLHEGRLEVLVDEDYKVDAFKNDDFPHEDEVFPDNVLEYRKDFDVMNSGWHRIISGVFDHLEGEMGRKLGVEGDTKWEKLRNVSEEGLQKIYDAVGKELGEELNVKEKTFSFTGYIYAYRELCLRYKRSATMQDLWRSFVRGAEKYRVVSELLEPSGYKRVRGSDKECALGEAVKGNDPVKALKAVITAKSLIKEKILSGEVEYDHAEMLHQFDEDWGRDDVGNAYGGSWVKNDMLGLYIADHDLTLIANKIIERASGETVKVEDSNILEAVRYLQALVMLSNTDGLLPRSFLDHVNTLLSQEGLDGKTASDIVHFMQEQLIKTEDFIRENIANYIHAMLDAEGIYNEKKRTEEFNRRVKELLDNDRAYKAIRTLLVKIGSCLDGHEGALLPAGSGRVIDESPRVFGGQVSDKKLARSEDAGRYLLSSKGLELVRMSRRGLSVPEGVIIPATVDAEGTVAQSSRALKALEREIAANKDLPVMRYGSKDNPLVVSVRSGGYFVMPGQLPTIVNVGLCRDTLEGFANQLMMKGLSEEDARWTAWDGYSRFLHSFGVGVLGIAEETFEQIRKEFLAEKGAQAEKEISGADMELFAERLENAIRREKGPQALPAAAEEQFRVCVRAVKESWEGSRRFCRNIGIEGEWPGTALIIQRMVFGNIRQDSGSGVINSRLTNVRKLGIEGDFMWTGQGEDIAQHRASGLARMRDIPDDVKWKKELIEYAALVDSNLGTLAEIEFTVEMGKVYILQVRDAYVDVRAKDYLFIPSADILLKDPAEVIPSAGGAYRGRAFIIHGETINEEDVDRMYREAREEGCDGLIAVCDDLEPEQMTRMIMRDDAGNLKIGGFISRRGGKFSHAADIARIHNVAAISGIDTMAFKKEQEVRSFSIGRHHLYDGDIISISGTTGVITRGIMPLDAREFLDESVKLDMTFNYFVSHLRRRGQVLTAINQLIDALQESGDLEIHDYLQTIAEVHREMLEQRAPYILESINQIIETKEKNVDGLRKKVKEALERKGAEASSGAITPEMEKVIAQAATDEKILKSFKLLPGDVTRISVDESTAEGFAGRIAVNLQLETSKGVFPMRVVLYKPGFDLNPKLVASIDALAARLVDYFEEGVLFDYRGELKREGIDPAMVLKAVKDSDGDRDKAVFALGWELKRSSVPYRKMARAVARIGAIRMENAYIRNSQIDDRFAFKGMYFKVLPKGGEYEAVKVRLRKSHEAILGTVQEAVEKRRTKEGKLTSGQVDSIRKDSIKALLRAYDSRPGVYMTLARVFGLVSNKHMNMDVMRSELEKISKGDLDEDKERLLRDILGVTDFEEPGIDAANRFDKLGNAKRFPLDIKLNDLILTRAPRGQKVVQVISWGSFVSRCGEAEVVRYLHDTLDFTYREIFEALSEVYCREDHLAFLRTATYQEKYGSDLHHILFRELSEQLQLSPVIVLGIPSELYMEGKLSKEDIDRLDSMPNVNIAILESGRSDGDSRRADMIEQLESMSAQEGAFASLFVEADMDPKQMVHVVGRFVKETREKVFVLMHPEIKKLDAETVKQIDGLPGMLREIFDKYLEGVASLQADDVASRICGERVVSMYDIFNASDTEETGRLEYLEEALADKGEAYFLAHFADGEAALKAGKKAIVPPGLEIARRRDMMKVNRKMDNGRDRFFVTAPEGVVTEEEKEAFRSRLMDMWMLNDVLEAQDIVILDRKDGGYSNAEIMAALSRTDPGATVKNTGIRCLAGSLRYEDESILQVDLAPEASNNINQYEIMVNLLLCPDKKDHMLNLPGLRQEGPNGKLFIYLPETRAVDLEQEIRKYYDRYIKEVMVRA